MALEARKEEPANALEQVIVRPTPEKKPVQNFTELAKTLSPEQLNTIDKASMTERKVRLGNERGKAIPEMKGLSPELVATLKGMTPEQLLALNSAIHEEVLNQERGRRTADTTPAISIEPSNKVQPADARGLRQQVEVAFTQTAPSEEAPQAPAVPLATAAGGGMQPPHDPANDNATEMAHTDAIAEGPFDPIADKDIAGWTNSKEVTSAERQAQIDKVGLDSVERAVIDLTPMDPDGMLDTTGRLAHRSDLINQLGIEAVRRVLEGHPAQTAADIAPQAVQDPSIIPPQTRGPIDDKAILEMSGVGSNWADAGKFVKNVSERALDKTAEWLPHSPIGRLEAWFDRAGMRIMNAPQKLLYGALYRWRSEHATAAEMDYKKEMGVVAQMNATLAQADASRAATIAEHKAKGFPTADIAIKLESERAKAVKRIEKAQAKMDKAGKHVEHYNALKAGWAQKETMLAERTMAKVDRVLTDPRAELDALTLQKQEVAKSIEDAKQKHANGLQELQVFKAKLANNPTIIEQGSIPSLIEATEKELADWEKEIAGFNKESARIGSKMAKANTFISDWIGYRNQEARVTTKDRRTFDPGVQNIEATQAHEAPNLTHAPEPATPAQEAAEKEPSLELEAEEYATLWNMLFGKELKINPKIFAEGLKAKPNETLDIKAIEKYVEKIIISDGNLGVGTTFSPREVEARFDKIRNIIKQGRAN